MKRVRYWSANNARWLRRVYQSLETVWWLCTHSLNVSATSVSIEVLPPLKKWLKAFCSIPNPVASAHSAKREWPAHELPKNIAQWPLWWRAQ